MRDLMQQRFEKLRLAMLDCHRKGNADCVASFVVIAAGRAVAKDDFRHYERVREKLSVHFVEFPARLREKSIEAEKPEEIVIEVV